VCSLYYITVQFYLLKAAQNRGIIHTEQERMTNKNTNKEITKGEKNNDKRNRIKT
jgi:hypothetical protein